VSPAALSVTMTAGFTPSLMRNCGMAWVMDVAAKERAIAATVESRVIVFTLFVQVCLENDLRTVFRREANTKATG